MIEAMEPRLNGPRPIAGTIGLTFGGLWSSLGASGLPLGWRLPIEALGGLVTLALVAVLWTRRGSVGAGRGLFRRKGYIIAVALEIVAIYAASALLPHYGLQSYLIETVGVIVGLHFIGLWQATRRPAFLWISGCMCGVSVVSAFMPPAIGEFGPRMIVAGFGNALVLWLGAGWRSPR